MDDVDPNVQDSIGDTMLHGAAKLNYPVVVGILLDAKKKPDVNLMNKAGEKPLDIAIGSNRPEIVKLLMGAEQSLALQKK